jgi:amino acid permease
MKKQTEGGGLKVLLSCFDSIQSVVYYRLLATDIDGKSAYSKVVTLKLKSHTWQVRLLANPVLDEVRLAVSGVAGNVQVYINDVEGKPVYSNKQISANALIRIPAASLPHGMYVLVITNGKDKKSIRFVK